MRSLTIDAAEDLIRREAESAPEPDLVGVEVEWHVRDRDRPADRVPIARVQEVATAVEASMDGRITFEPGGQLEISSEPAADASVVIDRTRADVRTVRDACAAADLELFGSGMDPMRPPHRILESPRYSAMEDYFSAKDPDRHSWGRDMMCNTAAVQVNVGMGENGSARTRWRVAHDIGPVLIAAFASSPMRCGVPTGWKSTRQAAWWEIDPSRTRPANSAASPERAWSDYALDAQVMLVRDDADSFRAMEEDMSLRDWVSTAHEGGPDEDDLRYHLSTLFPPVRPRGWLELRMIDMPPGDRWAVPLALTDALVRNEAAAGCIRDICRPVSNSWVEAARHGLDSEPLATAARLCFELALDLSADSEIRKVIGDYHDEYVARRRTPADDILDSAQRRAP
jgi:glutamate--cysteine ligase